MQMSKKLLLIVTILVISGCATQYVSAPLPLPPKPDLPALTDSELACLSNAVYHRVAKRDLAHKHYQQRLEAVIRSTWKGN
jgi:hypothetical protein